MSCRIDTETPDGEVNYMMARLYPGHELPRGHGVWSAEN